MTVRIITGDCLDMLRTFAPGSVSCCVTSPPYYGLRDYDVPPTDWPAVEFVPGPGLQPVTVPAMTCCLGLEPDPWAFIGHCVEVFREVRRVLRDDGTLWLNIGDSYASNAGGYSANGSRGATSMPSISAGTMAAVRKGTCRTPPQGIKTKDLLGIPWMLAFALRADGWYLRQDIIWAKPNPMPESVRDRCTKAHEYLFLLSKSSRYYFDRAAIAEARETDEGAGTGVGFGRGFDATEKPRAQWPSGWATEGSKSAIDWAKDSAQGRGSNRNSFARETKYSAGDHGQKAQHRPDREDIRYDEQRNKRSVWTIATHPFKEAHYATFPPALVEPCILAGCPAGGVVLDPFGGAGTTGLVADRLGRNAVLIELSAKNADMSRRRIERDSPLFAQVECAGQVPA